MGKTSQKQDLPAKSLVMWFEPEKDGGRDGVKGKARLKKIVSIEPVHVLSLDLVGPLPPGDLEGSDAPMIHILTSSSCAAHIYPNISSYLATCMLILLNYGNRFSKLLAVRGITTENVAGLKTDWHNEEPLEFNKMQAKSRPSLRIVENVVRTIV